MLLSHIEREELLGNQNRMWLKVPQTLLTIQKLPHTRWWKCWMLFDVMHRLWNKGQILWIPRDCSGGAHISSRSYKWICGTKQEKVIANFTLQLQTSQTWPKLYCIQPSVSIENIQGIHRSVHYIWISLAPHTFDGQRSDHSPPRLPTDSI